MLCTSGVFSHKNNNFEPQNCTVEKVIRLSGAEYDSFARNMLRDQDFIRDNVDLMTKDPDGTRHCLLVVSDDRRDGILVESQGYDYARYAAFVPNVEGLLTVGRYPALAALTRNLAEITEYIAAEYGTDERSAVNLQDLETMFGYDLMTNDVLRSVVLEMLNNRPEIQDWELDKNELIVYGKPEIEPPAEDLSDPAITKTDMYAYGYGWDGMIPLGRERALEHFDNDHEVLLLYQDDTEDIVHQRGEITAHDGMFGVEDPTWVDLAQERSSIEVFILNRERYEKGETSGEWLALPTDAGTLYNLFLHIGVDRPSEGAFTITAVRVPQDYLRDHISKYDSLDELNMLASFVSGMEDFELEKLQAILACGVKDIGSGTSALINALCDENFDAFRIIDAANPYELGRYWEKENPDGYPEDTTYDEYGAQIAAAEKGVFTGHGYIYFRNKELSPEYTGIVPDEYKIVGAALQAFRFSKSERGLPDDKPSVLDQIKAARENPAPRQTRRDTPDKSKDKGGQEL